MPDAPTIYTIGHSNHSVAALAALLRRHGVALVVDVRSQPYSQYAPQHNREPLAAALAAAAIQLVYMGDRLGGRPADRSLYPPGSDHPDYALLARSAAFRAGLSALLALAAETPLAIMCSEGDHRHCHRHHLIAMQLLAGGARVCHIEADGTLTEASVPPKQLSLF